MIQILGLRSFVTKEGQKKTYDKEFNTGITAETTQELFEVFPQILGKIPQQEHYNLFYTVANCGDKKREFKDTRTIAFDLDKIKLTYEESYIDVVCTTLGLARKDMGIVMSGNGLHFLIQIEKPITESKWFKDNKAHYTAVCNKINKALEVSGLPGEADPAIFDARRLLRLPGTVNRKPDRPERQCKLLQKITHSVPFHLADLSGVPVVTATDQIDKGFLRKYPTTDPAAVLTGCNFLKHYHESPASLDEPTWYAALSITARLDGQGSTGWERSHELSSGHPGYSREQTDNKITQALEASGPRTCESIQGIWGECVKCPNWGKTQSPIMLVSEGTIKTENTGFHFVIKLKNGTDKYVPCYEDLLAYFKRETGFKILADSRHCYVWDGARYVEMKPASLEAYAREHFDPKPKMDVLREWRQRIEIDEIIPMNWWEDTPKRKMNFLNGYLDIDTMEFRDHDPEIAFRQVLPYEYNPVAKAQAFTKMLELITGGDEDTQKVLLEFMGYSMSNDDCWAQKAIILTGEGANGKSTFLDTMQALAGDENFSTVNLAKADEQYNLSQLDKKLFNIAEEVNPKALAHNSTFKTLVTGGKMIVRLPREIPYQITNTAKMFMTCNELPESTDNTYGFYRRLLIVPFNQKITQKTPGYDPHMKWKLRKELPGIFNMAIAGYKRLVKNKGFTDAQAINQSIEEYTLENDTVLAWVKDFMVVHENGGFEEHFTPIMDLYQAYRETMKVMGREREAVHKDRFAKRIRKLTDETWGIHPLKYRDTKKYVEVQGKRVQVRGFQGVSLTPVH